MTVLSRSKNAAARVTSHDCKWSGSAAAAPRAVHTRSGHPQFAVGSGTVCRSRRGLGAVSDLRVTPRRPSARRQRRRRRCSTTCSALLAAAGAEPELADAVGPRCAAAYREAPLVLVGADALAPRRRPGAAAPARRRRRGRRRAAGRRVGGGGRGGRRAGGRAARRRGVAARAVRRRGARPGRARPAGRRRRRLRGRRREHGRDGARRWPPRRARCWSTLIRWGGGLDLLLGARARGGPALAGAGRAARAGGGRRAAAALPEVRAACTCWRRPRAPRAAGPRRGAGRGRRGGRSVGCPVVVDLPRPAAGRRRGGLADADVRRARGARPAAVRRGRAAAGRGAADRRGRRAQLVVRAGPGGLGAAEVRRRRRPAGARRRCRTTAARCRAASGASRRRVGPRSPLAAVARRVLGAVPAGERAARR